MKGPNICNDAKEIQLGDQTVGTITGVTSCNELELVTLCHSQTGDQQSAVSVLSDGECE
jgi:hypothetical protein